VQAVDDVRNPHDSQTTLPTARLPYARA
jgi:hypothetical protein